MKRNEQFIKIYTSLFENSELTIYDIVILSLIKNFSSLKGYCYAKNETIANKLNISVSTVARSIKKLVKLKYLSKWPCSHGKITYRVLSPCDYLIEHNSNIDKLISQSKQDIKEKKFDYDWLSDDSII